MSLDTAFRLQLNPFKTKSLVKITFCKAYGSVLSFDTKTLSKQKELCVHKKSDECILSFICAGVGINFEYLTGQQQCMQ